jgi:TolB-like protein/tetratricopeptide (TPR) repeat protein
MNRLRQLRRRKLVQWALAYLAAAWLLLQLLDLLGGTYGWPAGVMRGIPVVLAGGVLVVLVLAWYHGEKGRQRVTLAELGLLVVIAASVAGAAAWTGGTADRVRLSPEGASLAEPDDRSVAVLPFRNLSGDATQDYFAEGITEEILNTLSQLREIRVPARTSSFQFREQDLPMREIASRLGVRTVLAGSVRREGARVRISAQLIDGRDDRHLWSEQFDRELVDILDVQSEIAWAVVRALQVQLTGRATSVLEAPRRDVAAHDLYLQGLFYWNRRSAGHLEQAIRFFDDAARADPSFGNAYAGLALAHAVAPLLMRDRTVSEALVHVEAAAQRALSLDTALAGAHAALGYIYHWQWRWEDAERELARAIEINPSYPTARQWYGEHLAKTGRGEAGVAQLREAVALDPLSAVAHGNLGLVLHLAGHDDAAVAQLHRTHEMDPSLPFPLVLLHKIHLARGRVDEAVAAGRRWAELSGLADPAAIETLARATMHPDARPAAVRVLREWEQLSVPPWVDIAFYSALMEMPERALRAMEQGYRARDPMMTTIGSWWWAESLRADPRLGRIILDMRLVTTAQ